ncbi:MAG TPA: tetratricopeptide repeat protein, partial [Gammaproteobacteria bacterium]|nr:tetratricopeptide repeat protein [Gammaproteobacteria bacterium]
RCLVENDLEAATALIDRSLALNANSTRAWSSSGSLRCILGEPDAAIEHAERAIRLSPLDPSMWVPHGIIADARLQLGDYDQAASFARKSIRLHNYNLRAYHVLAASYAQLGELDAARETVRQLLELDPETTISRIRQIFPVARYKNLDSFLEGLRKAGIAE